MHSLEGEAERRTEVEQLRRENPPVPRLDREAARADFTSGRFCHLIRRQNVAGIRHHEARAATCIPPSFTDDDLHDRRPGLRDDDLPLPTADR